MDPITNGKNRVVTVAAKTSSEHPDTVESFKAENPTYSQIIPQNDLLIDSNKALEKIRGFVKMRGISSVEYRLIQYRRGEEPAWVIHFFAEAEELEAVVRVGAKTGGVEVMEEEKIVA